MGQYPVHRNFLRQVLDVFHPHEHGLRLEDVNKRDVQNLASCQRTAFPVFTKSYKSCKCSTNNLALGLRTYLDVVNQYLEIFVSLRAILIQRIEYCSYVVHFWRSYIILSKDLTLKENFLSRETFQDILTSCHFAVFMILDIGENYSYLDRCLDRTGSDGCEVFFSSNGSWIKNHTIRMQFLT